MNRFKTILALVLGLPLLMAGAAQAQQAYRIHAGDVLRIEVIEDSSLNRSTLVPPDGRITVPLAGSVVAAGQTVEEVQAALSQQLAPNFATAPSVFVSIERLAEPRPQAGGGAARVPAPPPGVEVYLMGEFNSTGKVAVEPGTTVLQLFAQAKGFTRFAATRRIQLRRQQPDGTEKIYTLDYDAIISGASPNGRVVVAKGDIFVAPVRGLFE